MVNGSVRVAVLGLGRIGKIHTENLAHHIPDAGVIAVSDILLSELATIEAKYDVPNSFLDYRSVLECPDVDAVAICTPTDTHHRMILHAAASGKHVFCEWPIDTSLDRIREISDAVEQSGIKLMVGLNRRFDTGLLKLREIVRSGKVGVPRVLEITSRSASSEKQIQHSGELFLDRTTRDFDMARYLVGSEVTEVYARASVLAGQASVESDDWDTSVSVLLFGNGALATIESSRKAVYGCDQRIEVLGSEGLVAVGNHPVDSQVHTDRTGTHSSLPPDCFIDRYSESYLREMRAFVKALSGNQSVPVGVNDGLAALELGHAALKSAKENRPVRMSEIHDRSVPLCGVH